MQLLNVTIPDLSALHLKEFIDLIARDSAIKMTGDLIATNPNDGNLKAQSVLCVEEENCLINQCWYNCRTVKNSDPSVEIVFGWHIFKLHWSDQSVSFAAGHHAVIRRSDGLVDVTPQLNSDGVAVYESCLFVPDSRVPFDFDQLKSVPALHWWPETSKQFWSSEIMDPYGGELPRFGVLKLGTEM